MPTPPHGGSGNIFDSKMSIVRTHRLDRPADLLLGNF